MADYFEAGRDRENSTVVVVSPAEAKVVEEDLKKLFRDVSAPVIVLSLC